MTVEITTLPNGLRIATDRMEHAKTVAVQVCVNIGSRYESEGLSGISHFLEHMAFKGTKRRTARDIAQEFDAIGGHFNAYTSHEHTVYYAKVLRENLPLAIDILQDILQHSVFDEDELARERNVILQEIAQCADTPDDLVFDFYQQTAYPDQSLGRSILGTEAHVSQFNRDQLMAYTGQYYCAPRIIIVAAGNVAHKEFVAAIQEAFRDLAEGEVVAPKKGQYQGGQHRKSSDLEQAHLIMGFEGISYHDDEIYTLQLLSTILGGGMSSRLFQEVREKRGLAYSVYSFASGYSDTGTFGIYAGTGEEHVKELIPIVCDELHKMAGSVTAEELNLAKTQIKAGLMMAQEGTYSRVESLGRHLLCFNRHVPMEEIIRRVDEVDEVRIRTLMERIVKKSPPTLAAIGKIDSLEPYEDLTRRLVG